MKPLEPITSMADLFIRAENDIRYKIAATIAFSESSWAKNYGERVDYAQAKQWMETWCSRNVGPDKSDQTCVVMVDYVNRFLQRAHDEYVVSKAFQDFQQEELKLDDA